MVLRSALVTYMHSFFFLNRQGNQKNYVMKRLHFKCRYEKKKKERKNFGSFQTSVARVLKVFLSIWLSQYKPLSYKGISYKNGCVF